MLVLICMSVNIGMSWAQDGDNQEQPKTGGGTIVNPVLQSYVGELMIVSATIMGFGGFGGLLAARFRGNDVRTQVACTLVIYAAILCKMVLHLYAILLLANGTMLQPAYGMIMGITMILVAIIVASFCVIAILKNKYDRNKSFMHHVTYSNIADTTYRIKRSPV